MRTFTEEHKRKLSVSHMGNKGFWEGKHFSERHKELLSLSHKGKHISPETQFKKGCTSWNKGTKGIRTGELNGMWKGDNVGYYALHAWVKRLLGKATKCIECGSERNVQWANKDHKYHRESNNWMQLCVPCHRKHDYSKGLPNMKLRGV